MRWWRPSQITWQWAGGASTVHKSPSAARLVGLVTTAVFINYIDRGNLATAAPLMQDELHLSASQLGVLLSAFYYGYVVCMPAMGWLAERYGAKRVLAGGVTLWSIATLTTGFAGGFATLLALRVLLGIGESVAFPCASKVLAHAVEIGRLGVANGVMSFGYLLGPAVGTLLGGYLMTVFGWRPVFVVFGAVSLVWLVPWSRVRISPPPATPTQSAADSQPSFSQIFRRRELWGASVGHFASNYGYYFIVSWLPFYLVKSRGFSMGSMVAIASWAYLLNALSALAMGWLADRWIRAGRSPTIVYKSIMAANHLAGIACMIGMVMLPAAGSIAALFVFEIVSGCSYPGLFAIPQILAGPRASARWVGVQNAAGNVAGLIAPAITGVLVDQTGLFDVAFALAAAVNGLGLIGWVFMLRKIAPIRWAPAPRAGAAP
jgi:MFS family permease